LEHVKQGNKKKRWEGRTTRSGLTNTTKSGVEVVGVFLLGWEKTGGLVNLYALQDRHDQEEKKRESGPAGAVANVRMFRHLRGGNRPVERKGND